MKTILKQIRAERVPYDIPAKVEFNKELYPPCRPQRASVLAEAAARDSKRGTSAGILEQQRKAIKRERANINKARLISFFFLPAVVYFGITIFAL